MSKNNKSKPLSKGKKVGIIGGSAVAGGFITDALLVAATPFTGGASLGVLAAKKTIDTGIAIALVGAGTVVGAGGGITATKVVSKKREEAAYKQGCEDTSKHYEAKFDKQAQEFANKCDQIYNDNKQFIQLKREMEKNKEIKDNYIKECHKYIQDLEKERNSLKKENKTLTKDKQELLNKLKKLDKELFN